jgi:hypothetical protein
MVEHCYGSERGTRLGKHGIVHVPVCHPTRKYKGLGLCTTCYAKAKYALTPQVFIARAKRYREQLKLTDPTRIPRNKKHAHMLRKYGITAQQYAEMLRQQNNACALCLVPFNDKHPMIDHDHATGVVRGLLCTVCNFQLGWFEKPYWHVACIAYLARNL